MYVFAAMGYSYKNIEVSMNILKLWLTDTDHSGVF